MDFTRASRMCSFCGAAGSDEVGLTGGLGAMICDDCVEAFHVSISDEHAEAQDSAPPWQTMSDTDMLATLSLILRSAEQNNTFAHEWVELLRSRKLSWAEIGKALGVSRQAVWERFGSKSNRRSAAG